MIDCLMDGIHDRDLPCILYNTVCRIKLESLMTCKTDIHRPLMLTMRDTLPQIISIIYALEHSSHPFRFAIKRWKDEFF